MQRDSGQREAYDGEYVIGQAAGCGPWARQNKGASRQRDWVGDGFIGDGHRWTSVSSPRIAFTFCIGMEEVVFLLMVAFHETANVTT